MSLKELIQFGALEDPEIDLAEASLLLAGLDHPQADLSRYRAFLEDLAGAVFELGLHAEAPEEQAAVLQTVLCGAFGFAGDRDTYDDPANANLIDVIDRRKGLPVALSILYIATARSVGWTAHGLNIPSHFIIRIGTGSGAVLQDPFSSGAVLGREDAEELLSGIIEPLGPFSYEGLEPLSNRGILVRLLNNIASRAEAGNDLMRALAVYERMTAIAPGYSSLWWERARLEQRLGRVHAARASLSAMLETTRDVVISKRIRDALERLARSMN